MRTAAAALVLGLVVFAGLAKMPMTQAGGDTTWSVHQAYSVLVERDLDLDEYRAEAEARPGVHWTAKRGHVLSNFPSGGAVVVAPLVAGAALVDRLRGDDLGDRLHREVPIASLEVRLAAALAAVVTVLLFLLLWRVTGSTGVAAALSLVFAFGTSVTSTISRALWMQGPALVVLLLLLHALWALEHPAALGRRWLPTLLAALIGPLCVLAYATRPTAAVFAVAVVALLARRPRQLAWASTTGAVALAGFFLLNRSMWGSWVQPYYRNRVGLSGTTFDALTANLVSPARGLLVWSPVVVLAAVAMVVALRRRTASWFDLVLTAWVLVHLVAVSVLRDHWWAGWSVGPRFLADVLPALFVLLAPFVASVVDQVRAGARPLPVAVLGVVVVLSAWGVFVNTRAGLRQSVQEWNRTPVSVDLDTGRVWDWSDPQFLR